MTRVENAKEFIDRHKDGSVRAKGQVVGNLAEGYWEWFRKDGTRMRSGYFRDGVQVGIWITYDRNGNEYKVSDLKDGKPDAPKTIINIRER